MREVSRCEGRDEENYEDEWGVEMVNIGGVGCRVVGWDF